MRQAKAKDRPPRRAHARATAGVGISRGGLGPDEQTRALRRLTSRRGATRAGADASQERESRRACAQPLPAAAGRASVQQGRPPLARSTRAAARRAPDARGLPAPDRFPRQRDRLARAGAGRAGARLARDPAADDGPGGQHESRRRRSWRASGDIGRFSSPRKLVSYLGLDPKVRESGNEPARHGRISKAGAAGARHVLGEVAWKVVADAGTAARLLRACPRSSRRRRSPRPRPRASWWCCSGTCSPASRTTPSSAPR